MRSSLIAATLAVLIFAVTSPTLLRAQSNAAPWNFPDFTATQIIKMKNFDVPNKVYRSGSSVYLVETAASSFLFMPSISKVYNFTTYPDNSHQCVVMRTDQAKMMPSPLDLLNGPKVERTPAGSEVVEGHPTKVENVVVTRPDGKVIHSKVWLADDLNGIPVKIESQFPPLNITAFYRDIVRGAPDPSLFTIPAKCTPLEKMGQVVEQKIYK
jgi:hypothetical protein